MSPEVSEKNSLIWCILCHNLGSETRIELTNWQQRTPGLSKFLEIFAKFSWCIQYYIFYVWIVRPQVVMSEDPVGSLCSNICANHWQFIAS